ncbi:MAG: S-methyl-5-thioribose-1-phosphate isomerase [bacterium]|nr:S-methyl-5-thioribose-1-phosphate isomerase [bacterium]
MEAIKWVNGRLEILDQTRLPFQFTNLVCQTPEEVREAIRKLRVRGAPLIGIVGAYGVVLGIQNSESSNYIEFKNELDTVINLLKDSRPTAQNLFWALNRMQRCCERNRNKEISVLKELLKKEAVKIHQDDKKRCLRIGENGAQLIREGDTILTHCNAGALATGGIGTALGVIYTANREGKGIKVFVDETRPLLQGARLTAWELKHAGIPVTLICDNMVGWVMKKGLIDCCIVGADRIASNGDTANKIGTYNISVLACHHKIPFYIAAPISTFDLNLKDGSEIPIEERGEEEVINWHGKRIAPKDIDVYTPAFDVTPGEYITAIITEHGIIYPPYKENLKVIANKIGENSQINIDK